MSFKLLTVRARAAAGEGGTGGPEGVMVADEALTAFSDRLLAHTNEPLNLVTIWGPARTGKSFFMNCLARADNLFRVSGEMEPCTIGADMSTTMLGLSEFAHEQGALAHREADASESTAPPAIGFVDVEGQGDRDISYEVLLATPLLLISKV